ncbi:hypothetical protein Tco_0600041 [Tanacetum coccineum]|uniref:Uncharacterized protein n=1 Tax=Tanacetum coccineum TaxID=301880 RepID=A0ABQ4WAN3_9ASTR
MGRIALYPRMRSRGFKASILHLISILGASWDFLDSRFAGHLMVIEEEILDDEPGHNHGGYPEMNVLTSIFDLTGDEDLTDEDGDIGVLVSLGDEIFLEGKKSQESNIGDSDNTGDSGYTHAPPRW